MAKMKERRKRTRIPISFEIFIETAGQKIQVETKNISLTGISCANHESFTVNQPCTIHLDLNENVHLVIQGKILRADRKEAIISFQSMDEDTFYHLKRIVQYNSGDPDKIEHELGKPAFS